VVCRITARTQGTVLQSRDEITWSIRCWPGGWRLEARHTRAQWTVLSSQKLSQKIIFVDETRHLKKIKENKRRYLHRISVTDNKGTRALAVYLMWTMGWIPSAANCGDGMSACCTAGPIVCQCIMQFVIIDFLVSSHGSCKRLVSFSWCVV